MQSKSKLYLTQVKSSFLGPIFDPSQCWAYGLKTTLKMSVPILANSYLKIDFFHDVKGEPPLNDWFLLIPTLWTLEGLSFILIVTNHLYLYPVVNGRYFIFNVLYLRDRSHIT